MTVNLFYWHEDLLSVTGNLAQKPAGAIALPTNLRSRDDMNRCIAAKVAAAVYRQPQTGLARTCHSVARVNFGI